jgi:cytochrome c556
MREHSFLMKGRNMKRLVVILTFLVLATWSGLAITAPPVNDVRQFMRKKLVHSQKILEGITTDDLETVAKHSQDLSLLSLEASWQVLQTPDYLQHSIEFRRAADALTEAAKKRNSDGAALAYLDVTMKCVTCHKYVRGVRMASK